MLIAVDHFGAAGDGATDDAFAVQAAINSASDDATIQFPPGRYCLKSPLYVRARTGLRFEGERATLCGDQRLLPGFFLLEHSARTRFSGLAFDQGHSMLPIYGRADYGSLYNCAVFAIDCGPVSIERCRFTNLYTSAVFATRTVDIEVANSTFSSLKQAQDQWLQHIHLQTCAGRIIIRGNSFRNAAFVDPAFGPSALFASGTVGSIEVVGNDFDYCGRNNAGGHRLGVVDFYGNVENVVVTDNVASNCMAQFSRISAARNVRIERNRVQICADAEYDYSTLTIESTIAFAPGIVGATNVSIVDNVFEDSAGRAAFTVGAIAYDWGAPLRGIVIARNHFAGARRAVFIAGPFSGITIVKNIVLGNPGTIEVVHTSKPNMTALKGSEHSAVIDGLRITGNIVENTGRRSANAVVVNLLKQPRYIGSVGSLVIAGNRISASVADASVAISVRIDPSRPQGKLTLFDNETTNYATALEARGVLTVTGSRNRALGVSSTTFADDKSNGSVRLD